MALECFILLAGKVSSMTELRTRFIEDLRLAGLAPASIGMYVWAVRQLTAYYMVRPDQLTEHQVQQYLLYVRDELGCACSATVGFPL